MKTLVIFDERPERTRFFLLPDPGPTDLVMLDHLQAITINNDELGEVKKAALDLFTGKIDGTEDRIPEWPCAFDTNTMEPDLDARQRAFNQLVRDYTPDRIYWIIFL